MNPEIIKQLSTLAKTFNDKRVVSEGELKEVLAAIVTILNENKKGLETLTTDSKAELDRIMGDLGREIASMRSGFTKTQSDIEKAAKEQNLRAFQRLQKLIDNIKMPLNGTDGIDGKDGSDGKDGVDGKDGSPDSPEDVRDKLETLKGEDRLDASAIKNLPKFVKEKAKEMLVGGIRFFEQLADVSIPIADKRQDLIAQYKTTNKRWEAGIAITVSDTAPTNPKVNDLWVDIS